VQVIHFQQKYKSIPVHNSISSIAYSGDKLVYYKSNYYPDITIKTEPTLSKEEAFLEAEGHELNQLSLVSDENDLKLKQATLEVYPISNDSETRYVLVWQLEFDLVPSVVFQPIYYIDAHSG